MLPFRGSLFYAVGVSENPLADLRLYNTFSKGEEPFTPQAKDKALLGRLQALAGHPFADPARVLTMYTCGPTVYSRPHIGNYASFLMADLLRRWLEVGHHYSVVHVKNITDVGHLVRDHDDGEDKVEKEARRIAVEKRGSDAVVTHEDVIAVAEMYAAQYLEDEAALQMLPPAARPRASAYIAPMCVMIEELLQKGHAYATEDGIYFDVTQTLPTPYGSLSGNKLSELNAGSRVDVNEAKRHPADFALWKFCVGHNAAHVLRWKSPKGGAGESYPDGFPGWHIECSAMSASLLGEQIDLHTGGEDNIFPHHECEIAQSESVSGKTPFVRLWLHRRRIDLEGEKMSKSLGNVLSLSDVIARGFDPSDLRYYLLSVHYRTNLKFSWKGMEDARKARLKIVEWMEEVMRAEEGDEEGDATQASVQFAHAMNEDLNTPGALAEVFGAMNAYRTKGPFRRAVLDEYRGFIDLVRGTFGCFESETKAIPADALALAADRDRARATKDFAASDRLRSELEAMGFEVRDTAEGTKLRPR